MLLVFRLRPAVSIHLDPVRGGGSRREKNSSWIFKGSKAWVCFLGAGEERSFGG